MDRSTRSFESFLLELKSLQVFLVLSDGVCCGCSGVLGEEWGVVVLRVAADIRGETDIKAAEGS